MYIYVHRRYVGPDSLALVHSVPTAVRVSDAHQAALLATEKDRRDRCNVSVASDVHRAVYEAGCDSGSGTSGRFQHRSVNLLDLCSGCGVQV